MTKIILTISYKLPLNYLFDVSAKMFFL